MVVANPLAPGQLDLPVNLSRQIAAIAGSSLLLDFNIGGVPFLCKPTDASPLVRAYIADAKQQFDNSHEAGEQSFGAWWLRSQASLHGGDGQLFLDTTAVDPTISRIRCAELLGVDVHVPGKVTVLPSWVKSTALTPGGNCQLITVSRGGNPAVVVGTATGDLVFVSAAGVVSTINLAEGSVPVVSLSTDGAVVFAAINGKVKALATDGTLTTIATATLTGDARLGFAKFRLLLTMGPRVWQLDTKPGTPVALVTGGTTVTTAGDPFYIHPSPGWAWDCVADGPIGIYLGGHTGALSQLVLVEEIQTTGGGITLGAPTVQGTLPTGETLKGLVFTANNVGVMATTQGARLLSFTLYGHAQYGPLHFQNRSKSMTGAVVDGPRAVLTGPTGTYRLDLGVQVDQQGLFAVSGVDTTPTLSAAVVPNTSGVLVTATLRSDGIYLLTGAAGSGTITSSTVKFSTTEPKQVFLLGVVCTGGAGSTVTVTNSTGTSRSFTIDGNKSQYEFGVALTPAEGFVVAFTLLGDAVLSSFVLKALPQARRYKHLQVPLDCYDTETSSSGMTIGYNGFAADRIRALEAMAATNTVVQVVDNAFGETYSAMVEQSEFRQIAGLERERPIGGVVNVALRVIS